MKTSTLEPLLNSLLTIAGTGNAGATAATADAIYDEITKDYRPLLALIPLFAGKAAADAGPLWGAAAKALVATVTHPDVLTAMKDLTAARAAMRVDALNTYMAAGFAREEAMRLVVVDAEKPLFGGASLPRKS